MLAGSGSEAGPRGCRRASDLKFVVAKTMAGARLECFTARAERERERESRNKWPAREHQASPLQLPGAGWISPAAIRFDSTTPARQPTMQQVGGDRGDQSVAREQINLKPAISSSRATSGGWLFSRPLLRHFQSAEAGRDPDAATRGCQALCFILSLSLSRP